MAALDCFWERIVFDIVSDSSILLVPVPPVLPDIVSLNEEDDK